MLEFEKSILLVNTGISRFSNALENEKIKKIKKNKKIYLDLYNLCIEAKKNITPDKNLSKVLSPYINESWKIKKKLAEGVTNSFLDNLYNHGMKNGAMAGKLLGSGSGGFMMFITANERNKIKLKKKFYKNVCVDVKFDFKGSRIISDLHDPYKINS